MAINNLMIPSRPQMLELAVQTVLHKNKTRLIRLAGDRSQRMLNDMAHEITCKALTLQQITESVVREIDSLHQHAELHEDAMI